MASAGSAALASPAAAACETTPPAWEAILTAYIVTSTCNKDAHQGTCAVLTAIRQSLCTCCLFPYGNRHGRSCLHMSKSSTSM